MEAIVGALASATQVYWHDQPLADWTRQHLRHSTARTDVLRSVLEHWSQTDGQQPSHPRPVVLLLDEVDALVGDTLISLLRQIRAGYAQRPHAFPQTIILCGV
ncbi:MAG: hypothetical protein RLZZ352_2774, partial [Pseudomonadota bacterium]